jgi:predicted transcriptional regulator
MTTVNHDKYNKARTQKIKVEMALNDHSKTKLASLMGLSLSAVIAKLNEKNPWSVKDLELLAAIYGKDREYFF